MNLIKNLRLKWAARRILSASIKDIRSGHWLCGSIGCPVDGVFKGCAMGLVAWNGGVRGESGAPEYYADAPDAWNEPSLLAIRALASAAGSADSRFTRDDDADTADPQMRDEQIVVDFNDSAGGRGARLNPESAEAWFKKARSLVLGRA